MNIKWYKNKSDLYATVSKNNIVLNAACRKLIEDYAYCRIGYNESDQSAFIQVIEYERIENKEIEGATFNISTTRSYSRISCTDFIDEFSKVFNIDFSKEKKVEVEWNDNEKMFILDINKGVNKNE